MRKLVDASTLVDRFFRLSAGENMRSEVRDLAAVLLLSIAVLLTNGCAEIDGESKVWRFDGGLEMVYHFPAVAYQDTLLAYQWVATLENTTNDTFFFEDELISSEDPPSIHITLLDAYDLRVRALRHLFQVMRPDVVEQTYTLLRPDEAPSEEIRNTLLRRYANPGPDESINQDGRVHGWRNRYRLLPGAEQILFGYTAIDPAQQDEVHGSTPHVRLLTSSEVKGGILYYESSFRPYPENGLLPDEDL